MQGKAQACHVEEQVVSVAEGEEGRVGRQPLEGQKKGMQHADVKALPVCGGQHLLHCGERRTGHRLVR